MYLVDNGVVNISQTVLGEGGHLLGRIRSRIACQMERPTA
jgi:hypothetical protein